MSSDIDTGIDTSDSAMDATDTSLDTSAGMDVTEGVDDSGMDCDDTASDGLTDDTSDADNSGLTVDSDDGMESDNSPPEGLRDNDPTLESENMSNDENAEEPSNDIDEDGSETSSDAESEAYETEETPLDDAESTDATEDDTYDSDAEDLPDNESESSAKDYSNNLERNSDSNFTDMDKTTEPDSEEHSPNKSRNEAFDNATVADELPNEKSTVDGNDNTPVGGTNGSDAKNLPNECGGENHSGSGSRSLQNDLNDKKLFDKNAPGDYIYADNGNGKQAYGNLKLSDDGTRDNVAQKNAGGDDRREDDDGGHLIGTRFEGAPDERNIEAQNRNVNRGSYNSMEGKWQKSLENGDKVFVNVETPHDTPSDRPDAYMGYSITEHPNGNREWDAFSYTNASKSEQEDWNKTTEEYDGETSYDNPMAELYKKEGYNPEDYK